MQVTLFDLDHTLLNINASVHFGRYLLRQKLLSFCSFFRCLALYCLHQWGALSSQKFHLFVFKALLSRLSNSELQKSLHNYISEIREQDGNRKSNPFLQNMKKYLNKPLFRSQKNDGFHDFAILDPSKPSIS